MSTTYFVAYAHQGRNGHGYGMIDVTMSRDMGNMDDVKALAEAIKGKLDGAESVIILNWKEIDAKEPERAGAVESKEKEK